MRFGDVGGMRDHPIVSALLIEAIAVAGTLAGSAIGVSGSLLISRHERRHALNARMRDALGVFLGAVYPAIADLRALPDINGLPKSAEIIDRLRGERATYVATRRREREIFGDVLRDRSHRVAVAVADLQVLPLPEQVRDAVNACLDYLERLGQRRTPELKAEWTTIHARLASAAELLRVR